MILTPDEFQGALYKNEIEPNIKKGATLAFSHGSRSTTTKSFRVPTDVIMIAPKAPGHTVRSEFVKGGGIPDLIAVYQTPPATPRTLLCRTLGRRRRPYRYHRNHLQGRNRNRLVR